MYVWIWKSVGGPQQSMLKCANWNSFCGLFKDIIILWVAVIEPNPWNYYSATIMLSHLFFLLAQVPTLTRVPTAGIFLSGHGWDVWWCSCVLMWKTGWLLAISANSNWSVLWAPRACLRSFLSSQHLCQKQFYPYEHSRPLKLLVLQLLHLESGGNYSLSQGFCVG